MVEGRQAQHGRLANTHLSISWGAIRASTISVSASGTISITGSPGPMTPPTVCTASWWTMPSWGARMSIRLSWSSAATCCSASSASLPWISRDFLGDVAAQVLVDLQDLQLGLADLALGLGDSCDQLPRSPCSRAASRCSLFTRLQRHKVLLAEIADPLELLGDQFELAFFGLDLSSMPPICSSAAQCAPSVAPSARRERRAKSEQPGFLVNRGRRPPDRSTGAERSAGKMTTSRPSRSASSRARRAASSLSSWR